MATLENREDLVTESMGPRFPHHKPMISMIAGTGHKLNDLNKFPDCGKLIKGIHKPVLFIGAGKSNYKASKKYFDLPNCRNL